MLTFDLMSNGISRGIWVAIHKNKPYLRASFDRHIFSPFYLCSEMRYNYVEAHEICRTFTFKYLHQFLH